MAKIDPEPPHRWNGNKTEIATPKRTLPLPEDPFDKFRALLAANGNFRIESDLLVEI